MKHDNYSKGMQNLNLIKNQHINNWSMNEDNYLLGNIVVFKYRYLSILLLEMHAQGVVF
jgi:hypothetical protein